MMKTKELQDMIIQDSEMDISMLDHHSLDTAKLQAKYFKLYSMLVGEYKNMEYQLKVLKHDKLRYYKGEAGAEVYKEKPLHVEILKSQAPAYVEADEDVMELQKKIDILDIKLELVKDMKNSLSQRNWVIRNTIEFLKFRNGA